MHVAIDATPLTMSTGGLRRYTEELARALAREFPEDRYTLVSDQPFAAPEGIARGEGPRNGLERRWWTAGVHAEMRRCGAEVFHGTDFAVPYLPLRPSVMTLHDLSPWRDPAWHAGATRVRRRAPFLIRRVATMIITHTEAVRREAIAEFALDPSRVVAVHLAPREAGTSGGGASYVLYAGTIEPRKNVPLIVDAWRPVHQETGVELWIAGRRRDDGPWIEPEPGLRLIGEVDDARLAQLYAGCEAFLYPTFYEGFGLPVLEAMAWGAPVITSTDAAVTEVAGGAAIHVDPRDPAAWTAAMLNVLSNGDALRGRSRARAAEFSWSKTARATRAVYVEAKARFRRRR